MNSRGVTRDKVKVVEGVTQDVAFFCHVLVHGDLQVRERPQFNFHAETLRNHRDKLLFTS